MKISQLNTTLRELIKQLENDGFGKKALCDTTLGQQAYPQFDRFIKGTDLGIRPLERVLDGYGYDLLTIPVKKGDADSLKVIEGLISNFVPELLADLKEFLENRPVGERGSKGGGKVNAAITSAVDEIKDIIDNID